MNLYFASFTYREIEDAIKSGLWTRSGVPHALAHHEDYAEMLEWIGPGIPSNDKDKKHD